jgi:5'(3')-deoxyribonucleotidase
MKSFKSFLTEKQIIIGKGAKYGQVVFLAGGAGSGKGFATTHFLEGTKFKIRDVDEWKKAFLKIAAMKNKYPKIRKLDLRKPKDVFKLHKFVKEKGIKDKTLKLLLGEAKKGRLPNLMFDVTLKDKEDITAILPSLLSVGYDPKNINIVWVLTNYYIAVEQNKASERGRIVPDDIMLKTHSGAAGTMYNFINAGTPKGVNGAVHVVLGGKKHTIFWNDPKTGKPYDGSEGRTIVKDFKYITLKEPGKKMTKESSMKRVVLDWIRQNAPKTKKTQNVFGSGQDEIKEGVSQLPQLYIDMDQVLVDFLGGAEKVLGNSYANKTYWMDDKSGDKKELLTQKAPNLFRDLGWMKDGKELWRFVLPHSPKILSAHPTEWMPNSKKDKASWVQKNLKISDSDVHLVQRSMKRSYATTNGQPNVLIDDHPKNIKEWQRAGGIGILHQGTASTIQKLKKMGF